MTDSDTTDDRTTDEPDGTTDDERGSDGTGDRPARETIDERVARLETIVERLEEGDVSLGEARELHAEGRELLASLEADLDLGDGEVVERS